MTQSELNQSVEAKAQSFGGGGFSKRDLLYAAAMLGIDGRSRMTMEELSASVIKALHNGIDDQVRPQIESIARAITAHAPAVGVRHNAI
ncbi:hypothetical protein RDV64_20850 [Acuticoccus sp. MNP-M23]|uniref:hypothetical protein n=1 Tax=Acuticoccus sp. MNP-M23 TaxID=3072793 RepID=UPI0028167D7B|nr:hypothetical protein [Acuticoccus sp. MNP-M23]WMS42482.1 hypothetical protein RDV64_20850 [Acuticoccus sp. MNP-M23]